MIYAKIGTVKKHIVHISGGQGEGGGVLGEVGHSPSKWCFFTFPNLEEEINVKMAPLSITADPELKPCSLVNNQENAVSTNPTLEY